MKKLILILLITITAIRAEMSEGMREYLAAYLQAATAITESTIEEWGSREEAIKHSETIRKRLLPVAKVLLAKYSSDYEAGTIKSEAHAKQTANQLHSLIIGILSEE